MAINTGDWDISTTGAMTGIGAITMDGAFSQTGATTFSTGAGAISLNGDVTVEAAKTLTAAGGFAGPLTGAVTGNVIGNVTGNVNGNTLTTGSSTYTGTAGQTYTFPTTSATIARTDAANTFTGHQTIEGVTATGATGTGAMVFATSPTLVTPVLGVATATSVAVGSGTVITKITVATEADGGANGWTPDGSTSDFTVTADAASVTANSSISVSLVAGGAFTCSVYDRTASTNFKVKCSDNVTDGASLVYQIIN